MRLRRSEILTGWLKTGVNEKQVLYEVSETQSAAPQVCDHRGRVKRQRYTVNVSAVSSGRDKERQVREISPVVVTDINIMVILQTKLTDKI